MRSVYDYPTSNYKAYILTKRDKTNPYESKMAAISLQDYHRRGLENALTFMPYFVALEAKKEGNPKITDEIIAERLAKAKTLIKSVYQKASDYWYDDAGLDFKIYRGYDENFNSYDCRTFKAVIDHKITKEEEQELEDELWVHFRDPYCDGRDCTGAPFTSWIKFLRCSDRTIVLHRIDFDV